MADDLVREVQKIGRYMQPIINTVEAFQGKGGGSGKSFGKTAPPLGESPSGPVRYNKDGSPPTPANVDNSGMTKEKFP